MANCASKNGVDEVASDDSVIDEPKIFQKLSKNGQMYVLQQKHRDAEDASDDEMEDAALEEALE